LGPRNQFVEHSRAEIPEPPNKGRPNAMDATSNFGLRFAQASGSNAGMHERLLRRQALDRTVTGLSLISQGLAQAEPSVFILNDQGFEMNMDREPEPIAFNCTGFCKRN
jgi:hypothetical protein